MQSSIRASQHFNENWQAYQQTIQKNTLYHQEMMATLATFLKKHFNTSSFSFADIGCGDASTILPVLANHTLKQYIGIDAAPDVLALARQNLRDINCPQNYICANMINAVNELPDNLDLIFTSYAVHHLSAKEKAILLQTCQNKLTQNGHMIMIDGILKPQQTRDEWLAALELQVKNTQQLSEEQLAFKMQHPRNDDFPEEIASFEQIAEYQAWQSFEVLFQKDNYAFMLFKK